MSAQRFDQVFGRATSSGGGRPAPGLRLSRDVPATAAVGGVLVKDLLLVQRLVALGTTN